ncbi:hypothetical protein FB384_001691 [Prauserella sediminis]|uniref:Uncharacterized protein n=1 Tax=Prauserella sediminis TaxID=577680 RepID=A0A839XJR7_9PSEU|nr:hypothetical protein [Prauserella sediminis]MBB3662787.1 hypothetical protein [Prauserella sediminis]
MRNVRKTARKSVVRTGVVTAAAGIAAFGIGGVAQAQDSDIETGGIESTAVDGTATDSATEDTTTGESAPNNSATDDSATGDSETGDSTARDVEREDTTPKVIEGECDATVKGDDGEPLTVDAGAAAGAEGLAGIGTGSEAEDTLVSLPLKETLAGTGLSETGVVVDSLGQVCDTAQSTVNTLGATTRDVTDGLTPDEPAPEEPADPPQPGDPQPEPDPSPAPERPAPGEGEDVPEADVPPAPDAPAVPPADQGALVEPLSPVALPPSADITVPKAPIGPGMEAPNRGSQPGEQENTARKSGTARALPQASETDRTPLVLSVGALLLVVAGLSRAWIARKNA